MRFTHARLLMVVAVVGIAGLAAPLRAGGEESVPRLGGLTVEDGAAGPTIRVDGATFTDTVHYSPQPGVWIVEMPDAAWDPGVASISEPQLGIERAELASVDAFGRQSTRLTVWLVEPAELTVEAHDDHLRLEFAAVSASVPEVAAAAPSEVAATSPALPPHDRPDAAVPAAATAPAAPAAAAERQAGGANLLRVVPTSTAAGLVVELEADGPLQPSSFRLPSPERLVLDLPGVVNRSRQHVYAVDSAVATRVRVAQFRSEPTPITRVVVDLAGDVPFAVTSSPTGASLSLGATTSARVATAPSAATVAQAVTPAPEAFPGAQVSARRAAPEPSPWVADPAQLVEQAAAAQVIEAPVAADTFSTTEVTSEERQFTGEPITLRLKDADIKDVLRLFAQLTDLNIVVDPDVGGSVTVELKDVPWDQALDLILRINRLDYVLENNVLRVAPTARLMQEKQAAASFQQEQERAQPIRAVVKPLSYARATYVAGLLQTDSFLLSERGSVVVDERTNQLVIRDVVDRVEGILRLVETLDQPTPQVVIEGRIVETTRDFSYQLGVDWGFDAVMDQEHGNDTGLQFPNELGVGGSVNLGRGANGVLAFTFADILNTFNLDFILSAAERDGIVRIVSTPRVTTQNLTKATIRSGLQLPVQTIANNTVTVQYIDAALRMDVTPQITAEGTVLLSLDLRKSEPALGAAIQGGQNAPIFIRDVQTELLVRDGGTTVIGGIYQINDQTNENRVPGLWRLPVVGSLFKNKEILNRHDELLIFITPRIVKY